MMTSLRCADIRMNVWSGHSCLRLGLCRGMTGGENGGPLTFRCAGIYCNIEISSHMYQFCTELAFFVPDAYRQLYGQLLACSGSSWND